jgi:hypothetical protein
MSGVSAEQGPFNWHSHENAGFVLRHAQDERVKSTPIMVRQAHHERSTGIFITCGAFLKHERLRGARSLNSG